MTHLRQRMQEDLRLRNYCKRQTKRMVGIFVAQAAGIRSAMR